MSNPEASGVPQRTEQLAPGFTETDRRHIQAFTSIREALDRLTLGPVDMGLTIREVLGATVRPRRGDYQEIEDQIEGWVATYSFDTTSTRYGDRSSDVVTITPSEEGGRDQHTFHDPDQEGYRSAQKKREGLVYELALYLATSPNSLLSAKARGAVVVGGANMAAKYGNRKPVTVLADFSQDVLRHVDTHRESGDYGSLIRILGGAVLSGLVRVPNKADDLRYLPETDEVEYN